VTHVDLFAAVRGAADALQAPPLVNMSVDPGKLIIGGVVLIITAMGAALKFLGQRVLASIDAVGVKVDATALKVTKIDQELFGPDGTNGMRSDVKRISRQMEEDRTVLIELAVKADIDVPDRVR
jgi:hypothetical protein